MQLKETMVITLEAEDESYKYCLSHSPHGLIELSYVENKGQAETIILPIGDARRVAKALADISE